MSPSGLCRVTRKRFGVSSEISDQVGRWSYQLPKIVCPDTGEQRAGQLSAGDIAACAVILAIGQCTPGTGPSAIETEPFACRRCTVNGSSRGTGWIEGVKTMSPVNGEIGRENRAKTESTRHSPEGDIVSSCFCPAARPRRSDGANG